MKYSAFLLLASALFSLSACNTVQIPPPTNTPEAVLPVETELPKGQEQSVKAKNEAPTETKGVIEGSLSFPSQGIPAELTVCAETLDNIEVACSNEHVEDPKYQYGLGYQLEVPAGSYYVYAYVPGNTSQKAYYSEFVPCGLSVDCPSHAPIEVEVEAGATTEGIDPGDWYAPQEQ